MRQGLEPTYEYIKGQGWVPNGVKTVVWEQQGYRVTVMARKPEAHERWYAEPVGRDLEETIRRIKQYYNSAGYTEKLGNTFGPWSTDMLDTHPGNWVTVEVVKL